MLKGGADLHASPCAAVKQGAKGAEDGISGLKGRDGGSLQVMGGDTGWDIGQRVSQGVHFAGTLLAG